MAYSIVATQNPQDTVQAVKESGNAILDAINQVSEKDLDREAWQHIVWARGEIHIVLALCACADRNEGLRATLVSGMKCAMNQVLRHLELVSENGTEPGIEKAVDFALSAISALDFDGWALIEGGYHERGGK